MSELKEGIWIAQGPDTNMLIRVVGKSPMLEIVGAINLNTFFREGKVENLDKNSEEVLDIVSSIEKYQFNLPSITDAIKKEGIDKTSGKDAKDISTEEFQSCVRKFKEFHQLYEPGKAETMFCLWAKKEHNLAISQGKFLIIKIKASFQNPLVEHDALDKISSIVK